MTRSATGHARRGSSSDEDECEAVGLIGDEPGGRELVETGVTPAERLVQYRVLRGRGALGTTVEEAPLQQGCREPRALLLECLSQRPFATSGLVQISAEGRLE